MRKKIAIGVLVAAVLILLGSVYALLFGNTGFFNAEHRRISVESSGDKDGGAGKENQEEIAGEAGQSLSGDSEQEEQEAQKGALQEDAQNSEEKSGIRLTFSMGSDGYAEKVLPQEVLAAVEAINAGKSLAEATGMTELEGYFALTTTHMFIAKDEETGEEATGSGRLTVYVPNLLDGLTDVSALFYDCAGGQWRVIPAERVDAANKRISVTLNGSGVMTTIYRLE